MDSRAGKQENAGKDRHSDEGRCDQHGPISENCNGSGLSMHQSGENDNDSLVYRVGEGTFIEEALRDVTRGLSETELGQLAEELVYEPGEELPSVDERNKPHSSRMPDFCSSTVVTERQNSSRSSKRLTVTFNPVIKVYLIPDEGSGRPWPWTELVSSVELNCSKKFFVLCNSYCVVICFNLCLEKIKVDL